MATSMKANILRKTARVASLVAAVAVMSACSTLSDWFEDDELLEIKQLKPISAQFTPSVVWQKDIGKGVENYFSTLRPVYEYGKVYVAERHGNIMALDPASGNVTWQKDFAIFEQDGMFASVSRLWRSGESAKVSGLSVAYEKVFIGTENGQVIALNAETGEPLWTASIAGEILAAPAIDEGIVVVNTGSGLLVGLDANSGEQKWSHENDVPPLTLRGISAPVASNGGAIVGTPTGKLQVNILENGLTAWEAAITKPSGATELERIVDIDAKPLLFGGVVYAISYDGTLAAIELRSGRVIWKREYGAYRSVSLNGNSLFVVDVDSYVYALDRRNGTELWSQGQLRKRSLTSPEPVGDYIVVGDRWGYVHWIQQADGEIVARISLGGNDEDESVYVAPIVVENDVIAITKEGELSRIAFAK